MSLQKCQEKSGATPPPAQSLAASKLTGNVAKGKGRKAKGEGRKNSRDFKAEVRARSEAESD